MFYRYLLRKIRGRGEGGVMKIISNFFLFLSDFIWILKVILFISLDLCTRKVVVREMDK